MLKESGLVGRFVTCAAFLGVTVAMSTAAAATLLGRGIQEPQQIIYVNELPAEADVENAADRSGSRRLNGRDQCASG